MSKIKTLWKHNELRRGMILLFFCVLLVIFLGQTYIANKAEGIQYVPYNDKNVIAMQLYERETVQADFVCDKETFYGLKLYLYKKDKEKASDTYDGRISFLITDESGTVIRKEELMLKDFYWPDEKYEIPFEQPQLECGGRRFSVCVTLEREDRTHDIFLAQTEDGAIHLGLGVEKYGFLRGMYWFLGVIFLVGIAIIYYLVAIRKAPLHQIYIPIATVLGVFYCILLPPYVVPDEPVHYEESYDVANFLLGTGKAEDGMIKKRSVDTEALFDAYPSRDTYKRISENIWRLDKEGAVTTVQRDSGDTYSIGYLMPGIGLAIGRLLHLGTVWTYWLARWMNYLSFAVLVYLAIKRTPLGKNMILLFTMLPMVMQETMSVSYDCAAYGLGILIVSQSLKMAFEEGPVLWKDLVWYTVPAVLIAGIKGGVYLPICCVALIVPVKRFLSRKRHLGTIMVVLCLVLAGFLVFNIGTLRGMLGAGTSDTEQGQNHAVAVELPETVQEEEKSKEVFVDGTEAHYSISYIIHSPVSFAKILGDTLLEYGEFYLQGIIGGSLGWFSIHISWWVVCGYLGALLFSTIEPGGAALEGKQKLWLLLMAGTTIFLVFLTMFLMWTPANYHHILGVQGRYFLPAVPLLLLLLQSRNISCRKDLSPYLIFAAFSLQAFTWSYIARAVL